jgi:hypothetical protein
LSTRTTPDRVFLGTGLSPPRPDTWRLRAVSRHGCCSPSDRRHGPHGEFVVEESRASRRPLLPRVESSRDAIAGADARSRPDRGLPGPAGRARIVVRGAGSSSIPDGCWIERPGTCPGMPFGSGRGEEALVPGGLARGCHGTEGGERAVRGDALSAHDRNDLSPVRSGRLGRRRPAGLATSSPASARRVLDRPGVSPRCRRQFTLTGGPRALARHRRTSRGEEGAPCRTGKPGASAVSSVTAATDHVQ